jgi:hypothetical protein
LFSSVTPSVTASSVPGSRTTIKICVSPPTDQLEHGDEHRHGCLYNRWFSPFHVLNARSKDLLQKLIFTQLSKKCGIFSLTQNVIAIFTTARH